MMNFSELDEIFDELFPICRSITGPGIYKSLQILQKHIPLEIKLVATGTRVFDWTVPQEWKLNKATLHTEHGELVLTSEDSNLHVVNYSEPFVGEVSREELDAHLFSIPEFPEAIPYVTSYYKERWGLCISESQRQILPDCRYRVSIDSEKYDGHLSYGEYNLPGESEDTILISSYLCHPSMANNELSGPLALLAMYKFLANLKHRHHSYRFIIVPETIGSISFLATTNQEVLSRVVGGIVLTCLGGPSDKLSFKLSRRDWLGDSTMIDRLARAFASSEPDGYAVREFSPTSGSDERQYCSPGINMPIIQAAKTTYGNYKEYHTSKDDKSFMRIDSVLDSVEKLKIFVYTLEIAGSELESLIEGGEPMLGKRQLYPTINGPTTNTMSKDGVFDCRSKLNLLLNVISLLDGKRNIIEIVEKLNARFTEVMPIVHELMNKHVIRRA